MTAQDIVVADQNEQKINWKFKSSTDLQTNLIIYRTYKNILAPSCPSKICSCLNQGESEYINYWTSHSGFTLGPIKFTREFKMDEAQSNYEANISLTILKAHEKCAEYQLYLSITICLG